MKTSNQYDVIIIGGSYAGLAAAMALGRALRKVLIIDSGNPANKQTPYSHNFLTNDGKTPKEITAIARQQVAQYQTITFADTLATGGHKLAHGFAIETIAGETFTGTKLVFASGIKDLLPAIPGFAACWGISVLHCPYCHGYEVKKEETGILANEDAGFEFASLIANWTTHLTIYTNGPATFSKAQQAKLQQHRIGINESAIESLEHENGFIENIFFKNGDKAFLKALYARVPFQQHSLLPENLGCEINQDGYIKTDAANKTTVAGIYACGDNTSRMRTVANAVAAGTTTGIMLNKELIEENF